jgi:hypothetical protein
MSNPFRYFYNSPEVIRLVAMMYVRYPLSLRNVEDLLAERGIDISHHPCGAPYGFEMYYLNVMAGPVRKWRFVPAPEVEWIIKRDG